MPNESNFDLPPDLFSRNFLMSKGISEFKKQQGLSKIKILDIGGANGKFGDFIDPDDELVILDIRACSEPNSIVGDATCMTMFEDKSFDIVISSDVFEHIPQNLRKKFILESIRVAKYLVIHAAPFKNEQVLNCELLIRNFFREAVGYDHQWLKEHYDEGLPEKKEIESVISEKAYTYSCVGSNNIFNWLLIQYFDILKFTFEISSEDVKEIHGFYNHHLEYLENDDDVFYRHVYFITNEKFYFDFKYKPDIKYINQYKSKIFQILNKYHTNLKEQQICTIKTFHENEQCLNKISEEKITLEKIISENETILLTKSEKILDNQKTIGELQNSLSVKSETILDNQKTIGELQNSLSVKSETILDNEKTISELQKTIQEIKHDNEQKCQNIKDLENAIVSIQSTRSWKVVDFVGRRYCFVRHYFLSIKQEIRNKGVFRGIYSSFVLFFTRILNIKRPLRNWSVKKTKTIDQNVPKIIFLSGVDGDTRRYRVFHQQEELKHHGISADAFDYSVVNLHDVLDLYDIIILHRVPINPEIQELIIEGKQQGKIFIFETDDLVFHEKYAQYIRALDEMTSDQVDLYRDGLRRFNATMELCNYSICSTEYLKQELESYGKTVFINFNAVSDEMVNLAKKALLEKDREPKDTIRIGYMSGTKTHNSDFKVAEGALIQILTEFEKVQLVIGGYLDLSEKFSPFKERIIRLPFMDWKELPKHIAGFDINISPLEDIPFCNAKSDLKYFEAALLQVPTVASNVGGFKTQIKNLENGMLVSTSQEWYKALRLLITNEELRKQIGKNAEADVLNKRTTKITGKTLVKIIQEIKQHSQGEKNKSPLSGRYSDKEWPSFSIISVLYNKENEINYFLDSFFSQKYRGTFEIIFVDDCSTDNSVQKVTDFIAKTNQKNNYPSHPEIKILKNSENLGNCISRNIGIKQTIGDLCVIIDADCMVNSNFLTFHAESYKFNDFDVSIGPFNLETNKKKPVDVLQFYECHPEKAGEDCLLQDTINKNSFLNCITRNFCIRRDFITGDLFDPEFSYSKNKESGFGWEDIEMGYRLYQKQARIAYMNNAFSIHVSHPSAIDEREKPVRSIRNFNKLFRKHPELQFISRRWTLDTYKKITNWLDANRIAENSDRAYLDNKFHRFTSLPFYTTHKSGKKLKILTYRWHCAHQYEIFKLPYEFTLVKGLGTGINEFWEYDRRPLPDNVTFADINKIDIDNYDLAIMPFDENVLSPERTNGVIIPEWRWGDAFKFFLEKVNIPKIALCHGTPQFYGQYNINYTGENLMQPIEEERLRFCQVLKDTMVINNSYQAQKEWMFHKSKVIWHGFDPTEFPPATYQKGILVMNEKAIKTRPHYNGYRVYEEAMKNFPEKFRPEFLSVDEPDEAYGKNNNWYARCKFDNYVRELGKYSTYFNPTIRSPMPRTRGEAMMCGVSIVTTKTHDVELFMKNGVNGFYSDSPSELREYLLYLSENPSIAQETGEAGREMAMDIFNHDRFLMEWEKTLQSVLNQSG